MKTFTPFTAPDMDRTNADATLQAGIELGALRNEGEIRRLADGQIPYMLDREGKPLSLEAFLLKPLRVAEAIQVRTPKAFGDYVTKFKTTPIALSWIPTATILALLDYHDAAPNAAQHCVRFTATPTPDFRDWTGINSQLLDQEVFADFVEEHVSTIAQPDGAALKEMVQNFQVDRKLTYRSAVRTTSGTVQLQYDQEENARGASAQVPAFLDLLMAPYEGNAPRVIRARLRYRIADGGKLTIGVKLLDLDKVKEAAVRELFEACELACPGVPFVEGQRAERVR